MKSSFMRSKIPRNMVLPYDNTTWRTALCGCRRRTLCCYGEKCCKLLDTGGTTLRLNANVQHRQRWCFRLGDRGSLPCQFSQSNELCVEFQTNVTFFVDVPNNLPSLRWQRKSAHCTTDIWKEKHFHATKMFGADCDEVFVWTLVGLLLIHFRGQFM